MAAVLAANSGRKPLPKSQLGQAEKRGSAMKPPKLKERVKLARSEMDLAESLTNNGDGEPEPYNEEEDHLFVFPPDRYRKADHELGVLMSGNWQQRRVVYTQSVLALAHIGKEKMLDVIPLAEIVGVQDMDGVGVGDADEESGRILIELSRTMKSSADDVLPKVISAGFARSFARTPSVLSAEDEKESLRRLFKQIDGSGSGRCTVEETRFALRHCANTDEEIESFIRTAFSEGREEITFEEFWNQHSASSIPRRHETLRVRVVSAENIRNADSAHFWECADPYVEVICGTQTHKTKTVANSHNPEFNEDFDFVLQPCDERLRVKVWDHNDIKSDQLLGSFEIPLTDLPPGDESVLKCYKLSRDEGGGGHQDHDGGGGADDKVQFVNAFQIRTTADGYNMGRKYFFKAASAKASPPPPPATPPSPPR